MDSEKLLEAINAIVDGMRTDMAKLGEKCDSISAKYDAIAKKKDDDAEEDNDMARRVAADRLARSDAVDPSAFASLCSTVADLKKKQARPMADLNAFADAQAKSDAVLRAHDERAEPPMSGEDLVAYQIRMHRKMQKHSPKWKGVELSLITADRQAFENVLSEIRSDALQAGLNPVGLPLFQHREIVQDSPGGHKIRSFVGTGTIFKQMSRPVRHVAFIGTRSSAAHY